MKFYIVGNEKDVVSVYVSHNEHDFLLCSLKPGLVYQQTLDLGFMMGEDITFYTTGKGKLDILEH